MSTREGVCGRLNLSIQHTGSAYRVTIPKEIAEDVALQAGDGVRCEFDRETGELTYYLDE
jgi:antitoxin component of MazEF toxin-antitoxin module